MFENYLSIIQEFKHDPDLYLFTFYFLEIVQPKSEDSICLHSFPVVSNTIHGFIFIHLWLLSVSLPMKGYDPKYLSNFDWTSYSSSFTVSLYLFPGSSSLFSFTLQRFSSTVNPLLVLKLYHLSPLYTLSGLFILTPLSSLKKFTKCLKRRILSCSCVKRSWLFVKYTPSYRVIKYSYLKS